MEPYGLLEEHLQVEERIVLRILQMESTGLHPHLEMRTWTASVQLLHGMEHDGSLEEMEVVS